MRTFVLPDRVAVRTTCACRTCALNCEHMPGALIPEDLERIRGIVPDLDEKLLASPGALVGDRFGKQWRIPTLVPARTSAGACVFLTPDKKCSIHAVAPFSCAFFDAHHSGPEVSRLSTIGLVRIDQDRQNRGPYAQLRDRLVARGLTAPGPEESRAAMRRAWKGEQ